MDSYGHKPSNDEMLHDLMRIFGPRPTYAGATIAFSTDTERDTLTGPVERVMGAVEEYHADEANQHSLDTSPDGDAYMMVFEAEVDQAWSDVVEELSVLGININEDSKLYALLKLWAEYTVTLRVNQGRAAQQKALIDAANLALPFRPTPVIEVEEAEPEVFESAQPTDGETA